MLKFKRYTATAYFSAGGHAVVANLPFSYLTKRGALNNCRRMVLFMAKGSTCYKDIRITRIDVYEVSETERKVENCSIRYFS